MARYTVACDTCKKDMDFHTFGGNSRDRQWRADHWTHECDECKTERIKIENEKNAQKNKEEGLPTLQGSDKQIAWAETIRAEVISKADTLIDISEKIFEIVSVNSEDVDMETKIVVAMSELGQYDVEFLELWKALTLQEISYKTSKLFENQKASFWIDRRGNEIVSLLEDIELQEIVEKKEVAKILQKDAETEATVRPSEPKSETVAIIAIEKNSKITVTFDEKREDFRTLVKGHGFSWGSSRWNRNISTENGLATDRVAEIGNKLLLEGFIIRIFDEELRAKAIDGLYEPEHTRWIKVYKGKFSIKWKRYHEDFYNEARKIPTSKWDNPTVDVKAEQFEAVADFANEYDFKFTPKALELLQEAQRAKEAQLVPTVKKGADAKEAEVKQRDFDNVSDDVDSDLID